MKNFKERSCSFITIGLVLIIVFSSGKTYGGCSTDTAAPPFLAAGATPNLLLMIDNSASMYDPAYVDPDESYCFDDSYSELSTYAGYFENDTWYEYNIAGGYFAKMAAAPDTKTYTYYNTAYAGVSLDATPSVTAFVAKGNFLNWVTASKIDIEKKILTGGKYNATSQNLVLESRGCGNRRYVKQVNVQDSGGDPYMLTLAARPPEKWVNNTKYAANSVVTDGAGVGYITTLGGTSNGTSLATDTGVTWKAGDDYLYLTGVELFEVTETGFDNEACQDAVENLNSEKPVLGDLYDQTKDCMAYDKKNDESSAGWSSMNHALQDCWYYNKHGDWQPGAGPVQSIKSDCVKIYDYKNPADITPDYRAYVCYGVYDKNATAPASPDPGNYVGRCWDTSAGDWATWSSSSDTADECISQALRDYCGILEIPEVVDPSDQVDDTGEIWNAPAVLIDSGMISQMGEPLLVCNGFIRETTAPTGIIHDVATGLNIGIMSFNQSGSASECDQPDPYILYDCDYAGNRDGGKIDAELGASVAALVTAINEIRADSWTPIAEAMYNAIGYYTNNDSCRLAVDDFVVDPSKPPPITQWCQANNILIITDGASTADMNPDVINLVNDVSGEYNDGDTGDTADTSDECGTLAGSTLFDDLTYYAKHGTSLYTSSAAYITLFGEKTPMNITTHIVVAGTPRVTGTDECSPDVLLESAAINGGTLLHQAANLSDLERELKYTIDIIRSGASAGSAASVISSSRSGEGAVYQAIFWPSVEVTGSVIPVIWTGEVHALLVDAEGKMHEDTNENGALDEDAIDPENDIDKEVTLYFDEMEKKTRACFGELNEAGDGCNGTVKELEDIKYLWSASNWLNSIDDADILSNRNVYISDEKKRHIISWNDVDYDGVVDAGEVQPFTDSAFNTLAANISTLISGGSSSRSPLPYDFGKRTVGEMDTIINWIRGQDQTGLRTRETSPGLTWRLGDIVHSTPMSVSTAAERYHLLYKDMSYTAFSQQYQKRRHVIYFGANDGMIHAVNGGFYDAAQKRFCRTSDCMASGPELGAELWAYVPYNLLPHLNCLTSTTYDHRYYVDQRPRIFDVQIFAPDTDHPDGWGTILVGGMRFGGSKSRPGLLDLDGTAGPDYPADTREFISAYFILDITNPEIPPTLLGELTMTTSGAQAEMGFTTVVPTVVPMKEGDNTSWYLILGSGPTTVKGASAMQPKVAAFDLSRLTTLSPQAFRIPNALPTAINESGRFELTASAATSGFVSDMVTVDFDMEPDYKADVVYFGTVEGSSGGWSGKLYRLVTREMSGDDQVATKPSDWSTLLAASAKTNPLPLIELTQPITASPTIGSDEFNFWVYFGTGRFFDAEDKIDDSQQAYYGIIEPMDCDRNFTWEQVELAGTHNDTPGSRGLLKVDQIQVGPAKNPEDALLSCISGSCLPTGVQTFTELVNYIAGSGCSATDPTGTGTDGWYKEFYVPRERNLGSAALLGGLLSFTTYQPYDDACMPEGLAFLYGVYYQTGTAWYEKVFSNDDDELINADHVTLGRGLAITPNIHSGQQKGTSAFVQTTTGAIVKIDQINPLRNYKTSRLSWEEVSE